MPKKGKNWSQMHCKVPEKLRVSDPGGVETPSVNSIVSSRLDPTEVEQSDCNCENLRSQ